MLRAGPVEPIVPKPAVVTTVLGALKLARLKALNMSAWNRRLNRSLIENCLRNEKSNVSRFGPWTIPAPLLPRRVGGAAAKAAGLIQPLGPLSASSTGPPI